MGGDKYRLRCFVGNDPVTGRPRYASETIRARNITAARKALVVFVVQHEGQALNSTASVKAILAEYVKSLETKRRAYRTIAEANRTIESVINPVLGHIPVGELQGRHIDELIRKHGHLKPATVRRYIAVLSAGLGFAIQQGWIDRNPMVRASLPEREQKSLLMPTQAELLTVIGSVPVGMYQTALTLAVFTAARRGELCGLRWSDIDGDSLWIRRSIYRQEGQSVPKSTKGNRERRVALSEQAKELLYLWALECMQVAADAGGTMADDPYILSKWPDASHPINPDTLTGVVSKAAKAHGWGHIHLHSFRHYGATHMLAQGMNARDAAELLGHADGGRLLLSTYAHPTSERQKAAGAILGNLLDVPAIEPPTTNAPDH